MIKFQDAAKPASLFRGSQKPAGFKFEIPKSVKQDFAPYRFAGGILYGKILSRVERTYSAPSVYSKLK